MLPFLEIDPVCTQRIPVGILQPSFIREENLEPFCLSQDSRSNAALSSSQHHELFFIHFFLLSLSFDLSHLKGCQCKDHQNHPNQPKAAHDFWLWQGHEWLLNKGIDTSIARLLEMMMQRRHLENSFSHTILLFRILEISYLQDY